MEKAVTHVSLTDFRQSIATHFDRVERDREELVVTRQGHEPLVLLPLAELNSLRETLHLLGSPANARRLMRSIEQLDADQGIERSLIEDDRSDEATEG
ncbi:type II toxin-antitoxin system Phd/YefM family antitoxin [Methylobacterium aquaticum]|uniref:type II toxin-antitoxin system Phd/YefM family antitoxin n=1 Tax=Methylobacterium aquaticum TaxID=270351 RepID=UPI001AF69519|nr:type II toxin-antitoxin system prevent-host-death family antitoxin [Methylobacterium aquaticum]QRE75804.1 type II toxin-antitoxin system prevent-host-death family antitoxin [Methylobacterium aquaticum]